LNCSPFYVIKELNRLKELYKLNVSYSEVSFYLELNKTKLKDNLSKLEIDEDEWINQLSNKLLSYVNKIEKAKVKKVDQVNISTLIYVYIYYV